MARTHETTIKFSREVMDTFGEWDEVTYELDIEYETYRAEPDVGIMSDGIEWIAAKHKGVDFHLTPDEETWVMDKVWAQH